MESAYDTSKVKAFLYTILIYFPLGLIGVVAIFLGNTIFNGFKQDLFSTLVGGSLITFGIALIFVFFLEPFLKLLYFSEAVNSPINKPEIDVDTNTNKQAIGVKIDHEYDLKEVANEIIKNECSILGKPYCLKVAKVSGVDLDENGKVKSMSEKGFVDLEKLVGSYAKAFGRPALYAAEVVLEKYPDLKFKTIYQ